VQSSFLFTLLLNLKSLLLYFSVATTFHIRWKKVKPLRDRGTYHVRVVRLSFHGVPLSAFDLTPSDSLSFQALIICFQTRKLLN
jgi:hypothetical protein